MRKTLMLLVALFSLAAVVRAQDNNTPAPTPAPAPASPAPSPAPGGNGGGNWKKDHPRRAEVNGRLNKNVKDGDMTKGQAANDRREERRMASKDGGHITKADQRKLNKRVDRQKARDKKNGK